MLANDIDADSQCMMSTTANIQNLHGSQRLDKSRHCAPLDFSWGSQSKLTVLIGAHHVELLCISDDSCVARSARDRLHLLMEGESLWRLKTTEITVFEAKLAT